MNLKDFDSRIKQVLVTYKITLVEGEIISGGLVRDLITGREWRDIDIFSSNGVTSDSIRAGTYEGDIFTFVVPNIGTVKYCKMVKSHQGAHIDFKYTDMPLTVEQVAMLNYVNICQCAWSQETGLWVSPDFVNGVVNGVIETDHSVPNWNAGSPDPQRHLRKIISYYPSFTTKQKCAKVPSHVYHDYGGAS